GLAAAFLGLGLLMIYSYCALAFLALSRWKGHGLFGLIRPPYLGLALAAAALVAAVGGAGRAIARSGEGPPGRASAAASAERLSAIGLLIGAAVLASSLVLFVADQLW